MISKSKKTKVVKITIIALILCLYIMLFFTGKYPQKYIIHPDDSGVFRAINNPQDFFEYNGNESNLNIVGMTEVNGKYVPIKMVGVHIWSFWMLFLYKNPFILNGILFLISSIYITLFFKKFCNKIIALLLFLSMPPLLFWSSGFFSNFSSAMFFIIAAYYLSKDEKNLKNIILFSIFMSISILLRYEMIILLLIYASYLLFTKSSRKLRRILTIGGVTASILLIILLFNLKWYGSYFGSGYVNGENQGNLKTTTVGNNMINNFSGFEKITKYFSQRLLEVNIKAMFRNINLFLLQAIPKIEFFFAIFGIILIFSSRKKTPFQKYSFYMIAAAIYIFVLYLTSKNYYIFNGSLLLSSYVRYIPIIYVTITLSLMFFIIFFLKDKISKITTTFLLFTILFLNIALCFNQGLNTSKNWQNMFLEVHQKVDNKNNLIISDALGKAFILGKVISPGANKNWKNVFKNNYKNNKPIYVVEQTNQRYYSGYVKNITRWCNTSKIQKYPLILKIEKCNSKEWKS